MTTASNTTPSITTASTPNVAADGSFPAGELHKHTWAEIANAPQIIPALALRGVPSVILALVDVKLIIVHGGRSSHQDEQVATALAYWAGAEGARIERRDPTPEELADHDILVMDVGGQHNPEALNFDHHQLPRDAEPTCAYSLMAEFLGVRKDLGELFSWFEPGIVLDSKGPFALAKSFGVAWDQVSGMVLTPSRTWHDQKWAEDSFYRECYTRWLANEIMLALDEYKAAKAVYTVEEIAGLRVLNVQGLNPGVVQDALVRSLKPQVVIFDDDRGAGLGLLRINDDPQVDFSRLEGDEAVLFAHKGGFIANTKDKDADIPNLLAKAKV